MNKYIIISRDVVFHENQFLDPSVFDNIEYSQYEFQTSFDIMINEKSASVNYIIPSHSSRPVYHFTPATVSTSAIISMSFMYLRASHTQSITSSIPFASISCPLIYEFIDMKSDHETSITSIQS